MAQITERILNGNVIIFENKLVENLYDQIEKAINYLAIPGDCFYLLFDDDKNLTKYPNYKGKLAKMLNVAEGGFEHAPDNIYKIFDKICDNG